MLYLLHFDPPYRHARHYLGFTARDGLATRILEHASGGAAGSPLVKAAMRAGCIISIARVWPTGDRNRERRMKRAGGLGQFCPTCKAEGYNRHRSPPASPPSKTEGHPLRCPPMTVQLETSGAESSSETRRTRVLEPNPSQLDAEQAAAQAGQLERDAKAQPANAGRLEAATAGLSSSADTVGVERLRSPSQASPPPLEY